MILTGHLFQISSLAKGQPGARLPAVLPTLCLFNHSALMKFSGNDPFNPRLAAVASDYQRHAPSRGIRGEPDEREALARRAAVPSRGNAVNITEDVRKYAAEQAISEEEALQPGTEEKSKEFVEAGAKVYAKA